MLLYFGLLVSLFWRIGACGQPITDRMEQVEMPTVFRHNHSIDDSLSIQYINLDVNPFLLSEVQKYIKEQKDSCQLFGTGFGYIIIENIKPIRRGRPLSAFSLGDEIEVEFDIGLSSFYPHQGLGTPLYYTFVERSLVLIYNSKLEWLHQNHYSMASQKKVKKLIQQTLVQELNVDFIFKGIEGNAFRLSSARREKMSQEDVWAAGSFTLVKLKTVVQYSDGTVSYRQIQQGKMR